MRAPASPARSLRRGSALWAIALFLLTLPAVTPRLYASDEIQYFAYLRSLWFDGDVSFENEYRAFYDRGIAKSAGFHETFLERTTETGRRINFATIGCAFLWAPFYGVADVAVRLGLVRGAAADGFSWPYVAAVAYASALYGFLSLVLSIALVGRIAGRPSRAASMGPWAALAVWLGTPLLFYMYVAPPMSHATSAFAVALFLLVWTRVRDRWTLAGSVTLGAAAAVMAMVREQDAFFAAGPALDYAWSAWRARDWAIGRHVRRVLAGAAAFAVMFLPQAFAYLALNGRMGPSRLVGRKMTWTAPHALGVLVSPEHGFFFWTPLALLALAGLAVALRRVPAGHPARAALAALAVSAAAQVYVAGSVESWTVAGAFGQRRFVALTAVLVVGLAAALAAAAERPAWRRITAALVVLAMWWNLALMVQFGAGLMDRQRLDLGRIAYNTFVTVPRLLPGLAWRYLFDRSSFYEATRQPGS